MKNISSVGAINPNPIVAFAFRLAMAATPGIAVAGSAYDVERPVSELIAAPVGDVDDIALANWLKIDPSRQGDLLQAFISAEVDVISSRDTTPIDMAQLELRLQGNVDAGSESFFLNSSELIARLDRVGAVASVSDRTRELARRAVADKVQREGESIEDWAASLVASMQKK